MSLSNFEKVIEFMTYSGQEVNTIERPNLMDNNDLINLRIKLIEEEINEYIDANNNRKLITTTDKYAVPLTNNSVTIHSVIPGPISYDNVVTIFSIISIVVLLILIIIFLRQYIM